MSFAALQDRRAFLRAEWRHLAMLNFEVDRALVQALVPDGTELDDYGGRTFVSLVGFRFLDTRVFGLRIPRHADFEEVNLRFYVRRKTSEGWRRGVVFVKELVPRIAIALTARVFYGENYAAVPMSHQIDAGNDHGEVTRHVAYRWRFAGQAYRLHLVARGEAHETSADSEEEFITEHFWGYARQRHGATLEYRVEHPRWHVWTAREARFEGDAARLYGERFVACLTAAPASAFLVDGSAVTVSTPTRVSRRGE